MVKKTHIQGGLVTSLLTAPILIGTTLKVEDSLKGLLLLGVYVGGACAGSLLPDIDIKSSYISKKVPLIHRLYGSKFKHRGFTHSILALFLMCIWCMIISLLMNKNDVISSLLSGSFMGCVSHIFLDLFTVEGVALFSPINKTVCLAKIKTGSKREKRLNKFLDFTISILIGFNMYMTVHNIGIRVVEAISRNILNM